MTGNGPKVRRRASRGASENARPAAMAHVTFASAADAARTRWDRTTPRERWLLGALAAAGLVALPFLAHDWADHRAQDAAADAARLQELQAADDGARLRSAAQRVAELEGRVRAWSPPAPSFATARVLVQQSVAVAAAGARVTGLEVHAAETPDRVGPATFVRAELSCSFSWASLAELTRRLAAERPGVVVERASTEGTGRDARLRMVILAPYREGAG